MKFLIILILSLTGIYANANVTGAGLFLMDEEGAKDVITMDNYKEYDIELLASPYYQNLCYLGNVSNVVELLDAMVDDAGGVVDYRYVTPSEISNYMDPITSYSVRVLEGAKEEKVVHLKVRFGDNNVNSRVDAVIRPCQ